MRTFIEIPPSLPAAPPALAAIQTTGHTSLFITIGALAGVIGSAIGTTATIGLTVLPILRQKFPSRMNTTQLDEYAEELFSLIACVNPLLQDLSTARKQRVKAELKDPQFAKELILSSPEQVVHKLADNV